MRRLVLLAAALCACAGLAAAVVAQAEEGATAAKTFMPNVVLYEPHLLPTLRSKIHPYAWAAEDAVREALPLDVEGILNEPGAALRAMERERGASFVETEQTPEIPESMKPYQASPGDAEDDENFRRAYLADLKRRVNDPARDDTLPIHPNYGPWGPNPQNPSDNWRRAVYGPRRRRMPYHSYSGDMLSRNPFRQPNNGRNAPQDMMFPGTALLAATHPELTNPLSYSNAGVVPFSSFGNAPLRTIVAANELRMPTAFPQAMNTLQALMGMQQVPSFASPMFWNPAFNPNLDALPPFARLYPSAFGLGGTGSESSSAAAAAAALAALPKPSPFVPSLDGRFFNLYGSAAAAQSQSQSQSQVQAQAQAQAQSQSQSSAAATAAAAAANPAEAAQ